MGFESGLVMLAKAETVFHLLFLIWSRIVFLAINFKVLFIDIPAGNINL